MTTSSSAGFSFVFAGALAGVVGVVVAVSFDCAAHGAIPTREERTKA
jgi:hypothetical protein